MAETGGGADGGIDIVLTKGTEKSLVQCKQWKAFRVGVAVVRELYGVMAAQGPAGGFVVTSGRFTDDATAFAAGRNIKLIDGERLRAMIRQAQQARPRHVESPVERPSGGQSPSPSPEAASPACPVCSRPMVKRSARRGANAGSEFWGCPIFPSCRGTRPIGQLSDMDAVQLSVEEALAGLAFVVVLALLALRKRPARPTRRPPDPYYRPKEFRDPARSERRRRR